MAYTEKDFAEAINSAEGELSAKLIKMSAEAREELPKKDFAVPGKEKYPIPDLAHARNALARVSQHGTPAEREMVRRKVYAKYPELKENFEEEHGESPTSKENVKKEEQGNIGKEGALLKTAACATPGEKKRSGGMGQGLAKGKGKGPMGMPKYLKEKTAQAPVSWEHEGTTYTQDTPGKFTFSGVDPSGRNFKFTGTPPGMPQSLKSPKSQAAEIAMNNYAKKINAAMQGGATPAQAFGPPGAGRISLSGDKMKQSSLLAGGLASTKSAPHLTKGLEEATKSFVEGDPGMAAGGLAGSRAAKHLRKAVLGDSEKKAGVPANIAKSPETSKTEMKKVLSLQQAMKAQKTAAEEEAAPGKSERRGRILGGLAGAAALPAAIGGSVAAPFVLPAAGYAGLGAGALGLGALGTGALGAGLAAQPLAALGTGLVGPALAGGALLGGGYGLYRGGKALGGYLGRKMGDEPDEEAALVPVKTAAFENPVATGEAVGAAAGLIAGMAIGAGSGALAASKGGPGAAAGGAVAGGLAGGLAGSLGGLGLGHVAGSATDIIQNKMQEGAPPAPGMPPKMGSYEIGGVKIATGESDAAQELGLSNYAGSSVQQDQQDAPDNVQHASQTATSKHLAQIVNPPKTVDSLFQEKKAQGYPPGYGQQGPVQYYPVVMRKSSLGEKAKGQLSEHRDIIPLATTAAGLGAGALLGGQLNMPGATLGGAGLGAAAGALGGHLIKERVGTEGKAPEYTYAKMGSYPNAGQQMTPEEYKKGWQSAGRRASTKGFLLGGGIGAGAGALGGALISGIPTGGVGALPGAIVGAGMGAGLGAMTGGGIGAGVGMNRWKKEMGPAPAKMASYDIGGVKIAAQPAGSVSKKDLQQAYQQGVRTTRNPLRKAMMVDVGDLVGSQKGVEERKPVAMVSLPTGKGGHRVIAGKPQQIVPAYRRARALAAYRASMGKQGGLDKTAQPPLNPMMAGGNVQYTVGPTPEDVAQYLRTERTGTRAGKAVGAGVGAVGGGTLGYFGGEALAKGLGLGAGGQTAGRLIGALAGGGAGGLGGYHLGGAAGEALGQQVAEHTTPASQLTTPYLGPQRSEQVARRLGMVAAARGGRMPTTAISPT
jgi:hypothetical protein